MNASSSFKPRLRRLPPRDAELLILKYAEGYGARELAERLGANVATIEARLHRARNRLRAELADLAAEFEAPNHDTILMRSSPLDDGFIDRIVDGELTPAELRAAIDRLDREPDGWKRCALAFLEAQCWRESFRALGRIGNIASRAPLVVRSSGQSVVGKDAPPLAPRLDRGRDCRGVVCHGLGGPCGPVMARRRANADRPAGAIPELRSASDSRSESVDKPSVDHQPAGASRSRGRARLRSNPCHSERGRPGGGATAFGPQSTGAEVPILAGPGINEQWLRNQPPPSPNMARSPCSGRATRSTRAGDWSRPPWPTAGA